MAILTGSVVRVSGNAIVSVYARDYAENVTPPAAIVRDFAHGNARVNGESCWLGDR